MVGCYNCGATGPVHTTCCDTESSPGEKEPNPQELLNQVKELHQQNTYTLLEIRERLQTLIDLLFPPRLPL